jgi:Ni/Fe-hydrogenase subunit HybB-like protein
LNRINVFIVGYKPPLSENGYFPALGEILVTLGLIATLMFIYRLVVTYLPVLQAPKEVS